MKLALGGFYGRGSVGDELLMCAVARSLREGVLGAEVWVLSARPQAAREATGCEALRPLPLYWTPASVSGARALLAFAARTGLAWPRLLKGLDALVLGGGSLLGDRDPRNLDMWLRTVRLHRRLGAKVFFYGISVGPIRERASLGRIAQILLEADGVTFRDRPSIDLMAGLMPAERLVQSADPVLSLIAPRGRAPGSGGSAGTLRIGLSLRPISSVPDQQADDLGVGLATALLERFPGTVTFLPMNAADLPLGARIASRLPARLSSRLTLSPFAPEQPSSHVRAYRDLDVLVSMRLHGCVLAALQGVPVVGLDCNVKIPGFLNEIGLGPYVSRVSDGIHAIRAEMDDVLDKTARLLEAWPALEPQTLARLRTLRDRERVNLLTLRQTLGLGPPPETTPPQEPHQPQDHEHLEGALHGLR